MCLEVGLEERGGMEEVFMFERKKKREREVGAGVGRGLGVPVGDLFEQGRTRRLETDGGGVESMVLTLFCRE